MSVQTKFNNFVYCIKIISLKTLKTQDFWKFQGAFLSFIIIKKNYDRLRNVRSIMSDKVDGW